MKDCGRVPLPRAFAPAATASGVLRAQVGVFVTVNWAIGHWQLLPLDTLHSLWQTGNRKIASERQFFPVGAASKSVIP